MERQASNCRDILFSITMHQLDESIVIEISKALRFEEVYWRRSYPSMPYVVNACLYQNALVTQNTNLESMYTSSSDHPLTGGVPALRISNANEVNEFRVCNEALYIL